MCDRANIRFAVALFSQRFQIQPGDWQATVEVYRLKESAFDLASPNDRIASFCAERGIACIDPTGPLSAHYLRNGKTLFLPQWDMHWNKRGHQIYLDGAKSQFADILEDVRLQLGVNAQPGESPLVPGDAP